MPETFTEISNPEFADSPAAAPETGAPESADAQTAAPETAAPAIADTQTYVAELLARPRPGEDKILAFYEHRLGLICTNPRLLLLPLDDHMVHRGDGVFESLKAERGRVYLLKEHLARLENSANSMGLVPPCSYARIEQLIPAVARAGGQPDCMIRVLLGRGPGGFGIDPAESPAAGLYIVAYRFRPKDDAFYARGLSAFRSRYPARAAGIANIKNTNYQSSVAMIREERERGLDLALSFDAAGFLAEAAISNVCLICRAERTPPDCLDRDGGAPADGVRHPDNSGVRLVVPEFSHALPGTTILRIIELLEPLMPVEVRKVREAEIFTALEMLQTGTTVDCAAITSYEGRPVGTGRPGPWATRIRQMLAQDLDRNGRKF